MPQCPNCGSHNCQTKAAIYQSGTSFGNTMTYNEQGQPVFQTSFNQTPLAARSAPPPIPTEPDNFMCCGASTVISGAILGIGYMIAIPLSQPDNDIPQIFFYCCCIGTIILGISVWILLMGWAYPHIMADEIASYEKYKANYQEYLALWQRTWICLQCGQEFF